MPPLMVSVAEVDEAMTLLELPWSKQWLNNGNDKAPAKILLAGLLLLSPSRRWRSASCSGANPVAAQLLLPRDVSAAANERPIGINLFARWQGACL